MEYWYFLFEGTFKEGSPKHALKGVCSSVMVPGKSYDVAKSALLEALDIEGIDLAEIDDEFQFDPGEIDESDEDNKTWLTWYAEVRKHNKPIFTPWQVFDDDDELPGGSVH